MSLDPCHIYFSTVLSSSRHCIVKSGYNPVPLVISESLLFKLLVQGLTDSVYGILSGSQLQSTLHRWGNMLGPCLGRVWSAQIVLWSMSWYLKKREKKEMWLTCFIIQITYIISRTGESRTMQRQYPWGLKRAPIFNEANLLAELAYCIQLSYSQPCILGFNWPQTKNIQENWLKTGHKKRSSLLSATHRRSPEDHELK